jgi:hypothetical protein
MIRIVAAELGKYMEESPTEREVCVSVENTKKECVIL